MVTPSGPYTDLWEFDGTNGANPIGGLMLSSDGNLYGTTTSFAHFSTVPIKSIVADINTDGASVFYTFNDIIAMGAPDSALDAVVAGNAARLGLKVTPDPEPDQHLFLRADQYSFVRQGVPSVFIFEREEAN